MNTLLLAWISVLGGSKRDSISRTPDIPFMIDQNNIQIAGHFPARPRRTRSLLAHYSVTLGRLRTGLQKIESRLDAIAA